MRIGTMTDAGRILMGAGAALLVIGGAVWGLGRLGFRGLPGDIRYESDNVRIWFPLATCLVLSVLISVGIAVWQWLRRR